jgi:hypothetical protein
MASKLGDSFVGDEDEWDGGDDDFNESVDEYVESPVKRKRGPALPWVLKKLMQNMQTQNLMISTKGIRL